MPTCAIVSFRLGGTDGVSIVAANWQRSLASLGFETLTVAGAGPVDRTVAGLEIGAERPPEGAAVRAALGDADLVVVENLCTIPLNLPAARAVGTTIRGRPAILHHHDPPWQRAHFSHVRELPLDDAAWRHVCINHLTRGEMARRGIEAETIYNGFDVQAPHGDRARMRARLDVAPDERLLAHPVRAIPRKGIPAALDLCAALDATYWLLGPAEDGYDDELAALLGEAECRVIRQSVPHHPDLYAGPDAIVYPSTWEGFGNPPVEAAIHLRPSAVGDYPVADELRDLGLRWFPTDDPEPLRGFLEQPDQALLEHNRAVVARHLSIDRQTEAIERLLDRAGWLP